jgi:hypothetical protein
VTLDLRGNGVRAVDAASFQFYGQLEEVDLSRNHIESLQPGYGRIKAFLDEHKGIS